MATTAEQHALRFITPTHSVAPTRIGENFAVERTAEHRQKDANTRAPHFTELGPDFEAMLESRGLKPRTTIGEPGSRVARTGVKPFLPTTNVSRYVEYKVHAHRSRPSSRAADLAVAPPRAPVAPMTLGGTNVDGASNVDGESPPDTHGAVGLREFVEVTNSHINIYDKANPANQWSFSHAAFFGYFTQALFDARVIYDFVWNRWVVIADAFPESNTVQYQLIAVSQTSSALGSFFIYQINVTFNQGDFWDFPQLGMDQDAIILTANVFDSQGNSSVDMFALPKAHIYNGLGFSVPVFTGLIGTLAPPIVLDQNGNSFLIAAEPSASVLKLYALRDSSRSSVNLAGPVDVPVGAYNMPAPAQQPADSNPADTLDTADSRFVNASTQVGAALWQVHTIDAGGLPTPRYYKVNTGTNGVDQTGLVFASLTSNDFNASIAANANNDMFLTWTSTDPGLGTNAEVRFTGCDNSGGACTVDQSGVAALTSGAELTADFDARFGHQRWGDYSAVTVDPANPRQAWLVNEDVGSTGDWGTRITQIGF